MKTIVSIIISTLLTCNIGSKATAQSQSYAIAQVNELITDEFDFSKKTNPFLPDNSSPVSPKGYELIWSDEFNVDGKPNEQFWIYEKGFVRNHELQWYQKDNANIKNGVLEIEGRRERIKNTKYNKDSKNWRHQRKHANYSSACIKTRGKFSFQFGILEVRAKIDTNMGMWPAIWTLGVDKRWPANGEVDLLEYYRYNGEAVILANAAWADDKMKAVWDDTKTPFTKFLEKDKDWPHKFHVWKMDWTKEYIKLYLDDELLNEIDLTKSLNADGSNPFHQAHYILLNLAIGAHGGDPANTPFPRKYEVDYVRVYQKK